MSAKSIEQVLQEHTGWLLELPGVVGTAIGLRGSQGCIKVLVVKQGSDLAARIPASLDGHPVVVESVGEVRALEEH
ncbi:MAG TPA: hypothetical protein PKY77_05550 [Phycisphaerae bacterium]|nr:hypothetical protein [Phycisphaerae bacterium]HRY69092.1 hypothetical protein [Phycisphaerae bacterium]HSA25933.1 hypothetical protein [Phycisphaerae bacterium]